MVVSLDEGVWRLDLPEANAYLVDDDGTPTLIDAGDPRNVDRLRAAIDEVLGDASAIDRILVTHYDVDHVGGLGRIEGLDAPVHAGAADAPLIAGEEKPSLRSRKGFFQRVFGLFSRSPTGPVVVAEDGDRIGGFTAYHTPGHTAGHTVYVHEERSLALLGDLVVATNGGFKPPNPRFCADAAATRRSIRRLVEDGPRFEVGAPGHGRPVRGDGAERLAACADALD